MVELKTTMEASGDSSDEDIAALLDETVQMSMEREGKYEKISREEGLNIFISVDDIINIQNWDEFNERLGQYKGGVLLSSLLGPQHPTPTQVIQDPETGESKSWAPVTLQEGDDLGILLGGADDLSDPGDGSTALVTSGSGKEGPDVLGAGAQPFADVLGVQELRVHRGSDFAPVSSHVLLAESSVLSGGAEHSGQQFGLLGNTVSGHQVCLETASKIQAVIASDFGSGRHSEEGENDGRNHLG